MNPKDDKSKSSQRNFIMLVTAFIAASFFRVVLNNQKYINNVIAFINIISLLFVCYIILDLSFNHFNDLLNAADDVFGEKIKKKKRKYFRKVYIVFSIFLLVIGVFYFSVIANPIINDIISFVSLFLSIETECIANTIGEFYFKKK